MAELTAKIPMTRRSFYTETQQTALADRLADLRSRYGNQIRRVCDLCYIPDWSIYGKLLIENAQGDATVISSAGAVGLMQIKPLSATDMVTLERQARRLTDGEKAELVRLLGKAKADSLLKAQMGDRIITQADLKKVELNLLIGAMHMSTLIAEHNTAGRVRFDLVALRYNQGYFYRRAELKTYTQNTDILLNSLGGEAESYVLKYVGTHGTLELTT